MYSAMPTWCPSSLQFWAAVANTFLEGGGGAVTTGAWTGTATGTGVMVDALEAVAGRERDLELAGRERELAGRDLELAGLERELIAVVGLEREVPGREREDLGRFPGVSGRFGGSFCCVGSARLLLVLP